MTNNFDLKIEEQDDALQAMSVSDLKHLKEKGSVLNLSLPIEVDTWEDNGTNTDAYIQQLELSELKKIVENSVLLQKINENSLLHKSKITGLDKDVILLIEKKKEAATLQQIITYCTKLNIPFRRLLPELYL